MSLINQEYMNSLFNHLDIKSYPANFFFFLQGENSKFYRLNKSKLRQVTFVHQYDLRICEKSNGHENYYDVQLSGSLDEDKKRIENILKSEGQNLDLATLPIENVKVQDSESSLRSVDFSFLKAFEEEMDLVGIISMGHSFQASLEVGSLTRTGLKQCVRILIFQSTKKIPV